eukprot:6061797-Pleurochrysis_carterae.AAC.1
MAVCAFEGTRTSNGITASIGKHTIGVPRHVPWCLRCVPCLIDEKPAGSLAVFRVAAVSIWRASGVVCTRRKRGS